MSLVSLCIAFCGFLSAYPYVTLCPLKFINSFARNCPKVFIDSPLARAKKSIPHTTIRSEKYPKHVFQDPSDQQAEPRCYYHVGPMKNFSVIVQHPFSKHLIETTTKFRNFYYHNAQGLCSAIHITAIFIMCWI